MPTSPSGRLGVMVDRSLPPEELLPLVTACERAAGVDDVWVVEDLSWSGAIGAAATALAATRRLHVGIGIVPAPLRNPALLAMELAFLGRLHPGRLTAGIGHGVQSWMRQVGAAVPSPLSLLEETFDVVRALLAGETVDHDGRAVHVGDLTLVHPPTTPVPLLAGVTGPKSLRLAGRVADGTILAEGTGPAEIAAARALIDEGRADADRDEPHRIVVLAYVLVADDPAAAADATRQARVDVATPLGVDPDSIFVLQGPVEDVVAGLRELWAAGADTVVVRPIGDPRPQVEAISGALSRL